MTDVERSEGRLRPIGYALRSLALTAIGVTIALALTVSAASAQVSYSSGSFPGPSISSHPLAIILDKKLDEKNGYKLDWQIRTTGAAFLNDFYTGVYNGILFSGLNYLATQYNKGAPIRIVSGSAAYPYPLMVRTDSGINKIEDLRGKTVGFPKVSYIFAYLTLVLKQHGIDIKKDLDVQNVNIIQAGALLERGEYDATMMLFTHAIILDHKAPGTFKVLMYPDDEVAKILGREKMYQVTAMRADWLDSNPGVEKGVMRSLEQAQEFLDNNIAEAVKVLAPKTTITGGQGSGGSNLPEYVVRAMYETGFAGRKMKWSAISAKDLKRKLLAEFQMYKDIGLIDKVPDEGLFHE